MVGRVDVELHGYDGVAAVDRSEGVLVNARRVVGHAVPFVAVAGVNREVHLVGFDEGEVHGDDAVATVDALQGLFVVAFLGVFGAVPVVAAAGLHVELCLLNRVDAEQEVVFGVAAAIRRHGLEPQDDAAIGDVLLTRRVGRLGANDFAKFAVAFGLPSDETGFIDGGR